MRSVLLIAENTFKEVIRNRVLYGLVVFAVLLIGLSLAVGQLSFSEQARITINFGLAGVQISAIVLAIFVGSTLVSREIEKKTVLTILARPVTRSQFLLGKFFGLLFVILIIILGFSLVLMGLLIFMEWPFSIALPVCLAGVLLESMVMLAATMLFGSFVSPFLTVSFAIAVFFIGHFAATLSHFIEQAGDSISGMLGKALLIGLPNLERFNWRDLVVYNDPVVWSDFGFSAMYGCIWTIFLVSVAALLLRGRDLT